MKTLSYNTEKEIRVTFMIVVFVIAIFATIKVKELQIKELNMQEEVMDDRVEFVHSAIPILPYADARLIEEPAKSADSQTSAVIGSGNEKEIAIQLKTWISNKSYWEEEFTGQEKELSVQMTNWIKGGDYWNTEVPEQEPPLASQLEAWISKGAFWNAGNE